MRVILLTIAMLALATPTSGFVVDPGCGLDEVRYVNLVNGIAVKSEGLAGCKALDFLTASERLYAEVFGEQAAIGQLNGQADRAAGAPGIRGEGHAVGLAGFVIVAGVTPDLSCRGALLIRIDSIAGNILEHTEREGVGTLTCGLDETGNRIGLLGDTPALSSMSFPPCGGPTSPSDPSWSGPTASYNMEPADFGAGWGDTGVCLEG